MSGSLSVRSPHQKSKLEMQNSRNICTVNCIIVAANVPNYCLINMASRRLFLAACFSFSSATNPTCLTLSLDKPILLNKEK